MPIDKKGKFHLNSQMASSADKMSGPPPAQGGEPNMAPSQPSGGVPDHLKAMHAELGGGKAIVAHSDGISHTTHQIGESGEVEGPHDHENIEALKDHMTRFLDEEEGEKEDGGPENVGERGYGGTKASNDHAGLYL